MQYMEATKHIPVLLQEAVEALDLKPGAVVVDATLGGGGHSRALLERVLPGGRVIALDADPQALERLRRQAAADQRLRQALANRSLLLVHENYSHLGGVLEQAGVVSCDAILADLGFSSDQILAGQRGFSFLEDGPLDMRLDQRTATTAAEIANTFSVQELARILRDYGDESEARRIALAIESFRRTKPIATTEELRGIIEKAYPKGKRYGKKIHPATKTFQALRIAVNQELEALSRGLEAVVPYLKVGGRLCVIS